MTAAVAGLPRGMNDETAQTHTNPTPLFNTPPSSTPTTEYDFLNNFMPAPVLGLDNVTAERLRWQDLPHPLDSRVGGGRVARSSHTGVSGDAVDELTPTADVTNGRHTDVTNSTYTGALETSTFLLPLPPSPPSSSPSSPRCQPTTQRPTVSTSTSSLSPTATSADAAFRISPTPTTVTTTTTATVTTPYTPPAVNNNVPSSEIVAVIPITKDDIAEAEEKRRRNRQSAALSRNKKRQTVEHLEERAARLQSACQRLQDTARELGEANASMRADLARLREQLHGPDSVLVRALNGHKLQCANPTDKRGVGM